MVARRRVELARARKAAGYTQEGLAEALRVDRASVHRWERKGTLPMPYLWPKLARLLGITGARLQELFADFDDDRASPPSAVLTAQPRAVTSEDMKRRTLVKWGMAASLGVPPHSTTVGKAEVNRLERAAARLHRLDQQHGGDTLWQAALAQAYDAVQLLEHGRYTETVGRDLLIAAGGLQMCAGWLALDAGEHTVARNCFGEALGVSRQASSAQLETRALANLAYQSNLLGRPREALRYAAGAEQAATGRGASSWLAVIPQFRLAIGNSLAGNAEDADRSISQARRVLDKDNNAADEEWSAFLSHMEVDGIAAVCAIELKCPTRAERLLQQAIGGYGPQFARNLAGLRIRLARARLDMGVVDGAVEATNQALDDLDNDVASWRLTTELNAVARRLSAFPEVDGVEGVLARHHAVNS